MRLWALPGDGPRRELEIEEFWPHKGHLVVKFAGIDSISDAETLIGSELQVPAGSDQSLTRDGFTSAIWSDAQSSTETARLGRSRTYSLALVRRRC